MKISLKQSLTLIAFVGLCSLLLFIERPFFQVGYSVGYAMVRYGLQLITLVLFLGLLWWMMRKKKVKDE
jgi:hypothetical protein